MPCQHESQHSPANPYLWRRLLALLAAATLPLAPLSAQSPVETSGSTQFPTSWYVDDYSSFHGTENELTVGDVYALWDSAPGNPAVTLLVKTAGGEAHAPNPRTETNATVVKAETPEEGDTVPVEGTEEMTVTVVIEYDNPFDKGYIKTLWQKYKLQAVASHLVALVAGAVFATLRARRRSVGPR